MDADLILIGGPVYTGVSAHAAEALAVRQGRILMAGRAAELQRLAGPGSKVVDLRGRAVIPGLIDAHLHLLSFGLSLRRVRLQDAFSLEDALVAVRAAAGSLPPGGWLLGGGWDRNRWGRLPTRWELDGAVSDRPVVLSSVDGHALWVNSAALRLAGIGRESANPDGGEIVRDAATGEATGVLLENAASLMWEVVPEPSTERCESALEEALRIAASVGLTGVQTFEGARTLSALQRLRQRDALLLRVTCHLPRETLSDAARLGLRTGFGDEWLRLGHLKLFLDGTLGSRTAHMLEPYAGSDGLGIPTLTREEFLGYVLAAVEAGIAPAVHAIGDGANRVALDVFEGTAGEWRPVGLRPRIEHLQLLHPDDADRLGNLGVIASMQPAHATSDRPVAERQWAGRTALAYAWRTVLDSGAVLAFGSDCPVEPIDPLLGLYAAITRRTPDGRPDGGWHPEQRLTPLEALRAYTLGSAYASGEESIKGSLEPGKLADFVVLSDDPFAGPPERFLAARVEATVVGGRLVYGGL